MEENQPENRLNIQFSDKQFMYLWLAKQIQPNIFPNTQIFMKLGFNSYLLGPIAQCTELSIKWGKYLREYKFQVLDKESATNLFEYYRQLYEIDFWSQAQVTDAINQFSNKFQYPPFFGLIELINSQKNLILVKFLWRNKDQIKKHVTIQNLTNQHQQVMKQDQLHEVITLSVEPQLLEYIENDQVRKLAENYFREIIDEEYTQYSIISLQFSTKQLLAIIKFSYQNISIFQQKDQFRIKNCLKKKLVHNFTFQFLPKYFFKKFLLFKSISQEMENQGLLSVVLFERIQNLSKVISKIIVEIDEGKKIAQQKLTIEKGMLVYIKNVLQDLETNPTTSYIFLGVKYNINQEESCLNIYGQQKVVYELLEILKSYTLQIENPISIRRISVSQQQAILYDKISEKQILDFSQAHNMNLKLIKNIQLAAAISINRQAFFDENSQILILIHKNQGLKVLPFGVSLIVRSCDELSKILNKQIPNLQQLQENRQIIDIQNGVKYILDPLYEENFIEIINNQAQYFIFDSVSEGNTVNIALVLPKNRESQFLTKVIFHAKDLFGENKIKIHVIMNHKYDIREELNLDSKKNYQYPKQGQDKYYSVNKIGKPKKIYYSKFGNKQIKEGLIAGKQFIDLINYEVKPQNQCFYNRKEQTLKHKSSNTKIKAIVDGAKITFAIKDSLFSCSFSRLMQNPEQQIVQKLYIGILRLNLQTREQINLFNEEVREIEKDLSLVQVNDQSGEYKELQIHVNYYLKTNKIQIGYDSSKKSFQNICQALKKFLESYKFILPYKINDPVSQLILNNIKHVASESLIEVDYQKKTNELIIQGYDQNAVKNFCTILPHLLKTNKNMLYPQTWVPQKNEISTFVVDHKSQEFFNVQKQFNTSKIKKLTRIQNKYVYTKYLDEKCTLMQLNQGKTIKQMMLFHGTSKTHPQVIYLDKEQCFNINYTSDRNLFGKGIYFARQSDYSNAYCYREYTNKMMLYCQVLVGDSEDSYSFSRNSLDTGYKDIQKKVRYQSVKGFLRQSDIYVVYKSRRAYPAYLIEY